MDEGEAARMECTRGAHKPGQTGESNKNRETTGQKAIKTLNAILDIIVPGKSEAVKMEKEQGQPPKIKKKKKKSTLISRFFIFI